MSEIGLSTTDLFSSQFGVVKTGAGHSCTATWVIQLRESVSDVNNNPLLRALLRAPVHVYHWRLGCLFGHRFLLLTHIGRRTGKRFQTVLEVMNTERNFVKPS